MILGPGDTREHGARRELFIVKAEALQDAFEHRLLIALVIDDKFFRVADGRLAGDGRRNLQGFDVAAKNAHAE